MRLVGLLYKSASSPLPEPPYCWMITAHAEDIAARINVTTTLRFLPNLKKKNKHNRLPLLWQHFRPIRVVGWGRDVCRSLFCVWWRLLVISDCVVGTSIWSFARWHKWLCLIGISAFAHLLYAHIPSGIAGSSTKLVKKKFRYMSPPTEGALKKTP